MTVTTVTVFVTVTITCCHRISICACPCVVGAKTYRCDYARKSKDRTEGFGKQHCFVVGGAPGVEIGRAGQGLVKTSDDKLERQGLDGGALII